MRDVPGPGALPQQTTPGPGHHRPRLLDLFCGGGGAAVGYHRAGFDVSGVDIQPHPDYPYPLMLADALDVLRNYPLGEFDVIHASPPCQRYSTATGPNRGRHPDLIRPVRAALRAWGGVWVIENVPGSPLYAPTMLCGSAFGLPIRRHRLFESNRLILGVPCQHGAQGAIVGVYGDHPDRPGGWTRPDGTSRGVKAATLIDAQAALGIDWMTVWDDLTDAIPPDYTHHLGAQLLQHLGVAA